MKIHTNSPHEDFSKLHDTIMELHVSLDEYYNDEKAYNTMKQTLILDSFKYHYVSNSEYREFCKKEGIGDDLSNISLQKIPLLPSSLFKRQKTRLLSVHENEIIKHCLSSGTLGNVSVVPRDDNTLSNLISSISALFPDFLDVERAGNQKGFVLGPNTEDAGDLWFSYVISCISLLMETSCVEIDGKIDFKQTAQDIKKEMMAGKDVTIIGPPFLILELCETIREDPHWPEFPSASHVLSAGGWKNRQRESINADLFRQAVSESFRMKNDSPVRDMYNMVELNSVIPECEYHQKHIPPWMEVLVRNPQDNQVLDDNEPGIISFLDSSSFSYPCFILSEDIGYVQTSYCKCGKKGKIVNVIRRMNNIEARGCALKMASGKEQATSSAGRFYQSWFRNVHIAKKEAK